MKKGKMVMRQKAQKHFYEEEELPFMSIADYGDVTEEMKSK